MPPLPDLPWTDWPAYNEMLNSTGRSPEAVAAGTWAVDILDQWLGTNWLDQHRTRGDQLPIEVVAAGGSLFDFARLLDLAVGLRSAEGVAGRAPVRRRIRGRIDRAAWHDIRTQLGLGALAGLAGFEFRLEPVVRPDQSPVDFCLPHSDRDIAAEVVAVSPSARWLRANAYGSELGRMLSDIGRTHGIDFEVEICGDVGDSNPTVAFAGVTAVLCATTSRASVTVGPATVRTVYRTSAGGQVNTRYPEETLSSRVEDRIVAKAAKAARSGANWLVIDALNGLLSRSPAAGYPPRDRAIAVARMLGSIASVAEFRGVVVRDGLSFDLGQRPEFELEISRHIFSTRTRLDYLRSRESIVLTVHPEAEAEALTWRRVLAAESDWTRSVLNRNSLTLPPEFATPPSE